jgi:hypothetical protein
VKAIAAGDYYTCALLGNGTVRCWGDSASGQLGNGDFSLDDCDGRPCSREPVEVEGLENASALALGSSMSCAVHNGGRLSCWGGSADGVNPKTLARCDKNPCATHPVLVTTDNKVTQIAVGSEHSCFVSEDGSVECWGDNLYGQIGVVSPPLETDNDISILTPINLPTKVPLPDAADTLFISKPKSGSITSATTCAQLREDKSLYCWGRNDVGQLGIGNVSQACAIGDDSYSPCATTPHKLAYSDAAERYFLGAQTGCVLAPLGVLSCWGFGQDGQLGVDKDNLETCGAGYLCATEPLGFFQTPPVTDVALGPDFTCILQNDNKVWCFGWSDRLDCISTKGGCEVHLSALDAAKQLVLTHLGRLCVLTQKGEIHCLREFNVHTGQLDAEPIWITQ